MDASAFIQKIDTLYSQSRFSELEAFLISALDNIHPEEIPLRITVLNELGTYYRGINDYDKAIAFFKEAADLLRSSSGDKTLDYATALNNMAGAFRMAGRFDEARRFFKTTADIYELYKDSYPLLYASGINNLALLDLACGDYEHALTQLEKALSLMSAFPEYTWEQATTHCNIGICLHRTGKIEAAYGHLFQARDMMMTLPESRRGHLAAIYSAIGQLYEEENKRADALAAYTAAREHLLRYYGENKDYEMICRKIAVLDPLKAEGDA